MDLFLANPFPSTVQISGHTVPHQERQHSTNPLKLPVGTRKVTNTKRKTSIKFFHILLHSIPDVHELNYHKQYLYGFEASASTPPVMARVEWKIISLESYPSRDTNKKNLKRKKKPWTSYSVPL